VAIVHLDTQEMAKYAQI